MRSFIDFVRSLPSVWGFSFTGSSNRRDSRVAVFDSLNLRASDNSSDPGSDSSFHELSSLRAFDKKMLDLIKLLKQEHKQEHYNPNLPGAISDNLTEVSPNQNLPVSISDHLKDVDLNLFKDSSDLIKYFENLKDEQGNTVIKSGEGKKFCENLICENLKEYRKDFDATHLKNLRDCITEEKPLAHSVIEPRLMESILQNQQTK